MSSAPELTAPGSSSAGLDAERSHLDRERFHQRFDRPLGRRVGRTERQHDAPNDAGHEEQLPVAASAHLRQRGLRDADRADGVQVEQSQQFGQRYGLHRGIEDLSGVDDDDVDITRGRERRGHAGVVGDVEGQPLGEVEAFEGTGIAGGTDYAVTAPDELLGDRATDSATGSGDEDS